MFVNVSHRVIRVIFARVARFSFDNGTETRSMHIRTLCEAAHTTFPLPSLVEESSVGTLVLESATNLQARFESNKERKKELVLFFASQ
jgi:hypothetical protein